MNRTKLIASLAAIVAALAVTGTAGASVETYTLGASYGYAAVTVDGDRGSAIVYAAGEVAPGACTYVRITAVIDWQFDPDYTFGRTCAPKRGTPVRFDTDKVLNWDGYASYLSVRYCREVSLAIDPCTRAHAFNLSW
jgi:hypothetical protein